MVTIVRGEWQVVLQRQTWRGILTHRLARPHDPNTQQDSNSRRTSECEEDIARASAILPRMDPSSNEGQERMAGEHEEFRTAPGGQTRTEA